LRESEQRFSRRCQVKRSATRWRIGLAVAQNADGSWVSPVYRCHASKRAASCFR
jgi:hypothetical protein